MRGFFIGLSIAAPVGPIAVLCIQRTLSKSRFSGLVSGIGAASADMIYGGIAALGLSFVSDFLINQRVWFGLIGGLFLLVLGGKTFTTSLLAIEEDGVRFCITEDMNRERLHLLFDYSSTFLLTLSNPMTILAFMAIYAGLGFGIRNASEMTGLWLVVGVFCGSTVWWITLSWVVSLFRNRFLRAQTIQWVNRVSGVVIIAFGIAAIFLVIR